MTPQPDKPEEFKTQLLFHPGADGRYDRRLSDCASDLILNTLESLEIRSKAALAERLGISRNRLSTAIKALGIEDKCDEIVKRGKQRRRQ